MPAPGPQDGHMSRASRDLSRGIAVKSNGFKYGGGNAEGWGTAGAKGRRLGKGQGARDVMARKKLRERLEKQRSEAASSEGGAEGVVGGKRKRVGGGGGGGGGGGAAAAGSKKGKNKEAAASGEEAKAAAATADENEEEEEVVEEEAEEDTRTDEERYTCETCGVKCGSRANFDNHCNSKKHKAAKQREKGKAILAALKAGK